jgi:hypothetical protein
LQQCGFSKTNFPKQPSGTILMGGYLSVKRNAAKKFEDLPKERADLAGFTLLQISKQLYFIQNPPIKMFEDLPTKHPKPRYSNFLPKPLFTPSATHRIHIKNKHPILTRFAFF